MEEKENLKSILELCDIISQELKSDTLIPFIDPLVYEEIKELGVEVFLENIKDEKIKENFSFLLKYLDKIEKINFFDKLNFIEYFFSDKNNLPEEVWYVVLQLFSIVLFKKIDEDFMKDLDTLEKSLKFYKPFIQDLPFEKKGIFFTEIIFINLIFMYAKKRSLDFTF